VAVSRMKSVFPPTRYDVRPWLISCLIAVLAYALLDINSRRWYNAGQQSVLIYAIDSIPIAPDSIMCLQWKWLQ